MWTDLRHGVRMLVKNPGFSVVAILSIAVGVGANAAMFSLADGLVLRPLSVPRAGEIVALGGNGRTVNENAGFAADRGVSYPDYLDVRDRARSFAGLFAYQVWRQPIPPPTGTSVSAKLPAPQRRAIDVPALVTRVAQLEPRVPIQVVGQAPVVLWADGDQLEQLFINLLRNAADAALETGGAVSVDWVQDADGVTVWIDDEGPGIASHANLFVPFFTTKPGGSGIGLALSRQIAEAHGGTLTLDNRRDRVGTRATVRLPVETPVRRVGAS